MKTFVLDTNVILRFLLHDHAQFYAKAENYFQQAAQGKITIILIPQVIFELDYVLAKVYFLSKKERIKHLNTIVKVPYWKVLERELLIEALEQYQTLNVDLYNLYLWQVAKFNNAQVLSFDQDFVKIKRKNS